jgi:hypothetical protein
MASNVDDAVSAALNGDAAMSVAFMRLGHQHALERSRASFDQDGRAIGAAIATELVQADTAGQAMNLKLAAVSPQEGGTLTTSPTVTKVP